MSRHAFARSVIIDKVDGTLTIDGVELPWWLEQPGPEVIAYGDGMPISVLHVPILVDGVISIRHSAEATVTHDPVLGDVGEYARKKVREEMLAAFPWLKLPFWWDD